MRKEEEALRMLEQVCLVANVADMSGEINIIKKALEAFEIIKKYKMLEVFKDAFGKYFVGLNSNCDHNDGQTEITEQEYKILKEVL